MKAALIQADIAWEDKKANFATFDSYLNQIENVDLIVLPEMFTTGFSMNTASLAEDMNGESVNWMLKKAADKQAAVMGSLIIQENQHYFNRLVVAFPNGSTKSYNKRHLFTMGDEGKHYTKGNDPLVFEHAGIKIKVIICYDLRFPIWCRNENEFDLLVCVANWPNLREYAWKHLLIARAIENQCEVLGVNRIGIDGNNLEYIGRSMAVDFKGNVVHEMMNNAGIIYYETQTCELQKFRTQFPVLMDRDSFKII